LKKDFEMNIIAISMVKNEEDIIETFCRYTLGYCDKLLVLEDNSDDQTLEILRSLEQEGLPIVVKTKDFSNGFYQYEKTNDLAIEAFYTHGADLVVPLDADEFITTDTNDSVRTILEGLNEDIVYSFLWRTYVLTEKAIYTDGNIFIRFDRFRPPEFEKNKIVISRKLFEDGYRMRRGHHTLKRTKKSSPQHENVFLTNLFSAHFPIRNIAQAYNKFIIGYLNYLNTPEINMAQHWSIIFESMKKTDMLSYSQIEKHSFYYCYYDEQLDIEDEKLPTLLTTHPVNTDMAIDKNKLLLLYTPETNNAQISLGLILKHFEKMVTKYKAEMENAAFLEAERIKTSNSWRLGRFLTSPARFIKKILKKSEH